MNSDSYPDLLSLIGGDDLLSGIYFIVIFSLSSVITMNLSFKSPKQKKPPILYILPVLILGLGSMYFLAEMLYTESSGQHFASVTKGFFAGTLLTLSVLLGFMLSKGRAKSNNTPSDRKMAPGIRQSGKSKAIDHAMSSEQVISPEAIHLKHEIQQAQLHFEASLLDQVKTAIIATNQHFQVTYWNKFAEHLFGWSKQEVIGKHILDILTNDDKRNIGDAFLKRLINKQYYTGTVKVPHKNGQYIPLEMDCAPVLDINKQLIGFTAVAMDMTRHVTYEHKLQSEKKQAEQLAVARQEFLATMSHEIRTPLNVVIGMTRLLRENDPRQDQEEYLKSLQFSANHLLTIINDILDMAKIEAGKIKLEKVDFNIEEVLDGMLKAYAVKAREKGLELSIDATEDVPRWLIGDQVRLTQILSNLLSNAIKFTKEGFICIKVSAKYRSDEVCRLHFDVMDSGIGISQDKLDKIFDRFTQAKEDTTRRFGGSGLGLSICKKLVQLQDGDISVRSEEGVGSTFSFSIDYAVSREENHEKEHQTQASYPLENVRLLLVDDDDANCVVASSFLRKMGVKKVTTATNGEEALKIVQQMPFDIVLMDLQMPIMNGYEATQAIRQLGGIYQALPIIALTADVVSDVREKVLKAGMNDYLSKPFDPDELNAIIARHLNVASRPASPVAEVEEEELVTLRRILEKYRDDTQFTQALLTSVYNSYQELNQQVEEAVSRWDLISLRRTIHKMQPTLKMMENYQLQEKLMLLREQLSQKETGEDQLNAISSDIFTLTGESLRMLEELRMEWSDKETKVM
jgi:PAS domain S-box-containing protein